MEVILTGIFAWERTDPPIETKAVLHTDIAEPLDKPPRRYSTRHGRITWSHLTVSFATALTSHVDRSYKAGRVHVLFYVAFDASAALVFMSLKRAAVMISSRIQRKEQ